jgi:ribonuclease R
MEAQKLEGVFHRTKSGCGYVTVKSEESDSANAKEENIPVVVSYNADVYEGDTALFTVQEAANGKRESDEGIDRTVKKAKLQKVIKRAQTSVIGEYRISEKKPYIIPDSYIPFRIPVKLTGSVIKCENGDKVEAEISRYKAVSAMRAIPVKSFGRADAYGANIKAAIYGTALFGKFSPAAEKQASAIKPVEARNYISKRVDLRSKAIFTFTDSVFGSSGCGFSVSKEEDGWKLGIHVADVAEYLKEGTELDSEAAARGKQILGSRDGSPMLPHGFINSICSFNEKREFLAVSLFVDFDEAGNATNVEFCESVIAPVLTASAADVDALISDGDSSALMPLRKKYSSIDGQIETLYELAAVLRAKRIADGGVDFDACEREFGIDADKRIRKMSLEYKNDSVLMVYEVFISAGKAAAEKLFYSGASCVYTGISEKTYDSVTGFPEDRYFMEENEYFKDGYTVREAAVSRGTVFEKHCFERITLECDSAKLSVTPIKHYIYGTDKYIEFFRPSEKYSDLVNLRAIKAYINEEAFDIRKYSEGLENEVKAGIIQLNLIKIMTIGYLNDNREADRKYEGSVIKSSQEGARILLDNGTSGIIIAEDIINILAVGERVTVRVKETDYATGRITFKP